MKPPNITAVTALFATVAAHSHQQVVNIDGTPEFYSKPYYPTPLGGRIDHIWQQAYDKARKIVEKMSIVEKVNLTTGTGWGSGPCVGNTGSVPRLGIPNLCLQDGPNGVRYADFVTQFPCGLAAGLTFNKELMYLRGKAIGLQHKKKGVHVALAPVVGPIGLKAQGGRNWESFGADPYLQGVAGAATVEGIQDEGVLAAVRHLVGNEQEHFRQPGEWDDHVGAGGEDCDESIDEPISSNIGDRAMHETYLWPFADAVRAGAGGVMCAYNRVNGTPACENSYLLNYLLKEELGFQGFVVSDWGAQHSGVDLALAGLDMAMPGEISDEWLTAKSYWGPLLTRAVYNYTMPQWRLNDMATRIVASFFAADTVLLPLEDDRPNFSLWTTHTYGKEYPFQDAGGPIAQVNWHVDARTHFADETAAAVAREAVVLLKNPSQHLPIAKTDGVRKLLVAGPMAGADPRGFNCKDGRCTDGVLTTGWGLAAVVSSGTVTPYEAVARRARELGMAVDASAEAWDLERPARMAENADMAVVFVGAASGDGLIEVDGNYGDRRNTSLWYNGDELIETIAANCAKTVVVITSTGPVDVERWADLDNVAAVLWTAPLGQGAGDALADVLFGDFSPSGKLPFTIARKPLHYVPIVTDPADGCPQDNFDRDIYLDYKFFDRHNIRPRYEFGHGLSYTRFRLFGLSIAEQAPVSEYLPYPEDYLPPRHAVEDDVCDPDDALFPHEDFDPAPGYIYPYLYDDNVRSLDENESFEYPHGYKPEQRAVPPLAGGGLGGNPALWDVLYTVSATVENDGKVHGGYAAQLYIEPPSTLMASPPKNLRGIDKVFLHPGETSTISFDITRRDLSVWDAASQQWIIQTGTYKVYVGSSSRKTELSGEIDIGC